MAKVDATDGIYIAPAVDIIGDSLDATVNVFAVTA
jgi:hypothetical protein